MNLFMSAIIIVVSTWFPFVTNLHPIVFNSYIS